MSDKETTDRKSETLPERQLYSVSQITDIYLMASKSDSLRFDLREMLSSIEHLTLVEILHSFIRMSGGGK